MAETTSNRSRIWVALVVILIAAGLLYIALPSNRDKVMVRTARVEHENLFSTVSTNGKVEPVADFQAHAPMASVIDALPIKLGQVVSKGQELVRLEASDAQSKVATAQASLQGAVGTLKNMQAGGTQDELLSERADLAAAQKQEQDATASLRTLQALQAKGAASANEVTAAQQRLTEAQTKSAQVQTRMHGRYGANDLATQRAQVTQAQSELASARSGYAGLDVHSPISGTVYSLPYARYDFVPAGDALVSVADLRRLQVRAYFDEPEIGKLAAGQPVKIVWDAKPNQVWHGHVTQAPTTVITYNGTRNVGVCMISVDDANGDLIPNTNVTVTVTVTQRFNVLSLPREALHTVGATNFVYRVMNGALVRTPVQIGVTNLTRFEITGGLNPGDIVALGATTDVDLSDGLRVKTQP